ncbi:MAG: DUF523 domain-containing protein [Candidatus Omnitrophica bacterium]|nr:DUF523 domain-containing protein [Candidatus Omnitrophota bacterium]
MKNRPKVAVSKCLLGARCRWDGVPRPDERVMEIAGSVEFIPVCPETGIGLGVPREPVRIVSSGKEVRLIEKSTGRDLTDRMMRFASKTLGALADIDGFILKDRSPSCGVRNAGVYASRRSADPVRKTSGFFAKEAIRKFRGTPVVTEGRLASGPAREEFLRKITLSARGRADRIRRVVCDL